MLHSIHVSKKEDKP